ncbi:MAG: MaoC family dehydratase [Devosia nanyangense]|uniref:MaoC family dehydratase n=1 Tax=Devosia nanyangense TaxID=1228055 RepID=A0A933L366_9HYPH|nr:MaoC family dehydratase [Devosia nanyangense]
MTYRFSTAEQVIADVGRNLGATDWLTIAQDRITKFAEATGDFQWLHVDAEKAANGPYGATIAHGFLTLSLTNMFLPELFMPDNLDWGVNYGVDRVRFPAPVIVNSRIRGVGELLAATRIAENAVQTTVRISVEIEGKDKPGCVADALQRYYFRAA